MYLGNPSESLRGVEFAVFRPYRVLPTYPVWLVDTISGIVTLSLICLIGFIIIGMVPIGLLKKFKGKQ